MGDDWVDVLDAIVYIGCLLLLLLFLLLLVVCVCVCVVVCGSVWTFSKVRCFHRPLAALSWCCQKTTLLKMPGL